MPGDTCFVVAMHHFEIRRVLWRGHYMGKSISYIWDRKKVANFNFFKVQYRSRNVSNTSILDSEAIPLLNCRRTQGGKIVRSVACAAAIGACINQDYRTDIMLMDKTVPMSNIPIFPGKFLEFPVKFREWLFFIEISIFGVMVSSCNIQVWGIIERSGNYTGGRSPCSRRFLRYW